MKYSSLSIQNFRGIASLDVADLARVNLLVGRNNCGKSSVLEAFFLLTGISQPLGAITLSNLRGLLIRSNEDLASLFRDQDFNVPIVISGKLHELERALRITPLRTAPAPVQQTLQDMQSPKNLSTLASTDVRQASIEGLRFDFQSNGMRGTSQLSVSGGIVVDPTFVEKLHGTYLRAAAVVQPDALERVVVDKRLGPIVRVLQQIEPRCTDLVLAGPGVVYADVGADKLLPVQVMGDGFKQVLALLIQLASGMFDVVWFDEIDTGLHFQSLSVLWHAVFAACKEFNVQLVATTHSYECVQAFAEAKNHEGDIALYRIDKTDGKHTAYRLSEEMVKVGIEKNFDVR